MLERSSRNLITASCRGLHLLLPFYFMVDFSVLSGRAFFFCSLLSVAAVAACSRHLMSHPRPPFGGVCLDDGKDRHFYVTHLLWRISHHTNATTITILPAVDLSRYRKRIPATQPVPLFICVFALFSPFTRGCSITTVGAGRRGQKTKRGWFERGKTPQTS